VWWIWTEREERLGSGGREKRMNERKIEEKGAKKRGPDHYCVYSGASPRGACLMGAHGRRLIRLQQA
jgi:hypothetical protein